MTFLTGLPVLPAYLMSPEQGTTKAREWVQACYGCHQLGNCGHPHYAGQSAHTPMSILSANHTHTSEQGLLLQPKKTRGPLSRNHRAISTDLSTGVHDTADPGDQVGRLLADFRCLVVQPPEDGAADLRQVGLHAGPQRVHHHAEPIQHDGVLEERRWVETGLKRGQCKAMEISYM